MRQYYFISLIYITLVFVISGCASSPVSENESIAEVDDLIQISVEQFDSDNMKVGEVTNHIFEEFVTCNGYIISVLQTRRNISRNIC